MSTTFRHKTNHYLLDFKCKIQGNCASILSPGLTVLCFMLLTFSCPRYMPPIPCYRCSMYDTILYMHPSFMLYFFSEMNHTVCHSGGGLRRLR